MMDRRTFLCGLTLGPLAMPLMAEARQTGKVPLVGVLGGQSPELSPPILALREGLRELGYVEGRNIAIEWRWAQGKDERYPDLAAELVKLKVDIIVAPTTAGAQAAQRATKTIPIVMGFVSDPVALGLVANLARPGGNITGLGLPTPEIAGKRLQLLREVAPTVARIAVLSDPSQPADLRGTEAAAQALGVQLQVWKVGSDGELDRAFTAIARERRTGIIILGSTTLFANRARIAQLAIRHRLPTSAWARELTERDEALIPRAMITECFRHAVNKSIDLLRGTLTQLLK